MSRLRALRADEMAAEAAASAWLGRKRGSGNAPGSSLRSEVLARLGFVLDAFQEEAFDAIDDGCNVLVSAPTGSGKTAVADYAVANALAASVKAFYTTPLKALSNQKMHELQAAYGEEKVGLLTGDTSIRADAPVVVMTTEVLRNMIYARSGLLARLGLVVLDEVHFLQDPYRGSVWEEVIILAPPEVRFVCLSATAGNAAELGAWIEERRGATRVVVEQKRPVVLRNYVCIAERRTRRIDFVEVTDGGGLSLAGRRLDEQAKRQRQQRGRAQPGRLATPRRVELVEALRERDLLPAIVFIFSRQACDDAVRHCVEEGMVLTSPKERLAIRERLEAHTEGIPDADLRALGYGPWAGALEAGIAPHHAGMVPHFRRAVEDCFQAGLSKVVFATETLALGINMPARTVVVERLQKVREGGRAGLTSGDYAQLTGRAGRRGLDSVGYAMVPWSPSVAAADVARLATSLPPDVRSSFRPTYNLAVNLVRRYSQDEVHYVVDRSFAQFMDRSHHLALSKRLDRLVDLLARLGYLDKESWVLSQKGEVLARIFHEADLLVSEALCSGLLDSVDGPSLAALLSAICHESRPAGGRSRGRPRRGGPRGQPVRRPARHRGPREAGAGRGLPGDLEGPAGALEELATQVREAEASAGVALTRSVDFSVAAGLWRWAAGEGLERALAVVEVAPGDFVRVARQVADLLRQLIVAHAFVEGSSLGPVARQALARIERGVVATEA